MSEAEFSQHQIGDRYSVKHRDGSVQYGWKLAYSNLLPGTYKKGQWIPYTSPVALVELPLHEGSDIREVPIHFISRIN